MKILKKLMRFADQIAGVIFNAHLVEEMQEAKRDAEIAEKIALMAQKEMEQEKIKSDQLLLNILPEEIARELRENGSTVPVHYKSVSVMFTDFKGFTQFAETMTPNELINELDSCFSYFDSLMDRFKLEKLKTIGDSYMCAGGIPS
jgi:adenylate cyclase